MKKYTIIFLFSLCCFACQLEKKPSIDEYLSNVLKVCDCKGKSGKTVDEQLESILPEWSYNLSVSDFEKEVNSPAFNSEILRMLELDFWENEEFCKCIKSVSKSGKLFESENLSYDETKDLESKMRKEFMGRKKQGCYSFLPFFLTGCFPD